MSVVIHINRARLQSIRKPKQKTTRRVPKINLSNRYVQKAWKAKLLSNL